MLKPNRKLWGCIFRFNCICMLCTVCWVGNSMGKKVPKTTFNHIFSHKKGKKEVPFLKPEVRISLAPCGTDRNLPVHLAAIRYIHETLPVWFSKPQEQLPFYPVLVWRELSLWHLQCSPNLPLY